MSQLTNLPKEYLSVSQLNTYIGCPEKYRRRYVENQAATNRTNADGLILGTAFHTWVHDYLTVGPQCADKANEYFFMALRDNLPKISHSVLSKKETGHLFAGTQGDEEAIAFFKNWMFTDDIGRILTGYTEELKKGPVQRPSLLEIYGNLVNYFQEYESEIFKNIKITESEKDIELSFERYGKEFRLKAIVDLLGVNTDEAFTPVVFDWKTTKRAWDEGSVLKNQDMVYSYILNKHFEEIPEFRYIVFSYSDTTGKVKHQIFSVKYDKKALDAVEPAIHEMARGINEKVFYKNEGSFLCSSDFCEYFSDCQSYKKGVKVEVLTDGKED